MKKSLQGIAVLACAALLAMPALAEDTVIHAGHLLDRPGKAPRGASTLLVRDGRISAVKAGFLEPAALGAAGARVVDLRERFVLPGLIDCHVHLESDTGGVAGMVEDLTLSDAAIAYRTLANAR